MGMFSTGNTFAIEPPLPLTLTLSLRERGYLLFEF
jgi:hypothetical protein